MLNLPRKSRADPVMTQLVATGWIVKKLLDPAGLNRTQKTLQAGLDALVEDDERFPTGHQLRFTFNKFLRRLAGTRRNKRKQAKAIAEKGWTHRGRNCYLNSLLPEVPLTVPGKVRDLDGHDNDKAEEKETDDEGTMIVLDLQKFADAAAAAAAADDDDNDDKRGHRRI